MTARPKRESPPPGSVKNRTFSKRFTVLLTLCLQPMTALALWLNPPTVETVYGLYVTAQIALAGLYMGVGISDLLIMQRGGLFNFANILRRPNA